MRLNIGCGFNKRPGFHNVDREALCRPDQVVDLERFPWPWPDNSITEIVADHVLEHLGASRDTWLGLIKEIWRVSAPDAVLRITVPHPRHDNFLHDPTHVRVVTPIGIAMFDQKRNIDDFERGGQETKLGLFSGVDLEVVEVGYDLHEPWRSGLIQGTMPQAEIERDMGLLNNVCLQIRIMARVVKPCRGEAWVMERFGNLTTAE